MEIVELLLSFQRSIHKADTEHEALPLLTEILWGLLLDWPMEKQTDSSTAIRRALYSAPARVNGLDSMRAERYRKRDREKEQCLRVSLNMIESNRVFLQICAQDMSKMQG